MIDRTDRLDTRVKLGAISKRLRDCSEREVVEAIASADERAEGFAEQLRAALPPTMLPDLAPSPRKNLIDCALDELRDIALAAAVHADRLESELRDVKVSRSCAGAPGR